MLIRHSKHGTGSGVGAARYLLQDKDHKGRTRPEITVLEGDPFVVGEVADSLSFRHKYSSAVLAWAPGDNPTREQINEVLQDYKKLAFAGLKEGDFALSAVLHGEEGGGVHVHVVSARVDLQTGLSINPCPPGVRFQYDKIAEAHNWANGWARPDDPERARTCSKGHLFYDDAAALRQGLQVEPETKALLTGYIENLAVEGVVESQAGVVEALKEFGEITRVGKGYVSIKLEGESRATRLKGTLFSEEFSREDTEERSRENGRDTGVDRDKSDSAFREFDRICRKKEQANTEKYRSKPQRVSTTIEQSTGTDRADKTIFYKTELGGDPLHCSDLRDHLRSQLGNDAILPKPSTTSTPRVHDSEPEFSQDQSGIERQRRGRNSNMDTQQAESMAGERGFLGDRDRAITEVQQRYKMTNDSLEIERFKTEINLSEYFASQGFQIDKKKSCASYAVMRKDDFKYVVTRDSADNHYVYTDAHNPKNSGTIVDAVQFLNSKNLGQVRRELRPWIGANYPKPVTESYQRKIEKTKANFPQIISTWETARPVQSYDYFNSRQLKKETVKAFECDTIRESQNGTLMFRHLTPESPTVSGFEYKSRDYAGFSKGGLKGLCVFRQVAPSELKKIVITETALDALSKAQIDELPKDTAYVSFAGNPSRAQLEQLKKTVEQFELEPIVAVDRDKGGDLITAQIERVLPEIKREFPHTKDWNSDLEYRADLIRDIIEHKIAIHKIEHKNTELKCELEKVVSPLYMEYDEGMKPRGSMRLLKENLADVKKAYADCSAENKKLKKSLESQQSRINYDLER